VALKKILMHHEKEGVSGLVCLYYHPAVADSRVSQFPITAIREIKLLKALSHVNILQLKEMAVERSKGKIKLCNLSVDASL
jgi:serine/threonine-protein kinase BUR1